MPAIELIVAAQAVDWRGAMEIDPRKGRPAGKDWKEAERELAEFAERTRPERREEIAAHLGEGTRRLYLRVREVVEPMLGDRTLDGGHPGGQEGDRGGRALADVAPYLEF